MTGTPRRAAIYVRISRDRTGAGLGVERQEADCRALADRLGWTVGKVYTDNDISAYQRRKPRPGYRQMLADLEAGTADAVLAWHTDRLHRRLTELEELITLFEDRDVAVATVTAGDLDLSTASGRRNARLLATIAQGEVEQLRERTRAAKAQAAASGKYRGGPRPFGYEPDGITPRPSEAVPLREAARAILAGRTLRALANEMTAAGVTTINGNPVDGVALRRLLLRPRNAGLLEKDGEVIGTAEWPAIIPEDEWRAVVGILTDPGRQKNALNPGRARRWLGSGIYVCGRCGSTMRAASNPKSRADAHSHVYVCKGEKHLTRTQSLLDEYVLAVIAARLREPDAADLLDVRAPDRSRELLTEAATLRARLEQAEADYAAGLINGRQLQLATRATEDRLADVDAALTASARAGGLGAIIRAADPAAAFLAAPVDQQAAVLDALAVVTVLPAPRGRPAGWTPGESYFDPDYVDVKWRGSTDEQ